MRLLKISIILLAALLTACAGRPTLYQWGSYEDQLYDMYSDPGKVPAEKQLGDLEADYQKARSENKNVPPGYHAHMGYLYYQLGKTDQALQSFGTERTLYPESAEYMKLLISRLQVKRKR